MGTTKTERQQLCLSCAITWSTHTSKQPLLLLLQPVQAALMCHAIVLMPPPPAATLQ